MFFFFEGPIGLVCVPYVYSKLTIYLHTTPLTIEPLDKNNMPTKTRINRQPHPPPDTLVGEIKILSDNLTVGHQQDALNIACVIHMTRAAFSAHEAINKISLKPLLDLQQEYISAWMHENGVPAEDVRAALASLEQAERTVEYLDALDRPRPSKTPVEAVVHYLCALGLWNVLLNIAEIVPHSLF